MTARLDLSVFRTSYSVHLDGNFRDRQHLVIINGSIMQIQLTEWALMFVLASHAQSQAGRPAPIVIYGGMFIRPEIILLKLQQLRADLPQAMDWGTGELMQAKWKLRRRLKNAGLEPNLVESVGTSGYRLSTSGPVTIALTDKDERPATWGFGEGI